MTEPEPDVTGVSRGRAIAYVVILAALLALFLICCGSCLVTGGDAPHQQDGTRPGALVSRTPDPAPMTRHLERT
jgi:hypothetical protein